MTSFIILFTNTIISSNTRNNQKSMILFKAFRNTLSKSLSYLGVKKSKKWLVSASFFIGSFSKEKPGSCHVSEGAILNHFWHCLIKWLRKYAKFQCKFFALLHSRYQETRDNYERPYLNQLKQYILLVCYLGSVTRCAISADLKTVARNRPLLRKATKLFEKNWFAFVALITYGNI